MGSCIKHGFLMYAILMMLLCEIWYWIYQLNNPLTDVFLHSPQLSAWYCTCIDIVTNNNSLKVKWILLQNPQDEDEGTIQQYSLNQRANNCFSIIDQVLSNSVVNSFLLLLITICYNFFDYLYQDKQPVSTRI